ncbi:MAG: hypothetical protein M1824_005223 [Vezdaea acicularis]|nr:MAG: hypothetical protein M1824_005223 [Vezdaea acicularis]
MFAGVFFAFWRTLQILTLIPTLGILAYFVHGFTKANELTPGQILTLFIVSVLAAVWAICTLFAYNKTRHNAFFVGFIDLCFIGAFIAGTYELRDASNNDCAGINFGPFGNAVQGYTFAGVTVDVQKHCSMLKACFAFGIMNCIFFFATFILAFFYRRPNEDVVVRETHVRKSGSRRRSGSGSHRGHRRQYY